jgi:zinc transport system substrate-binding protein
MNSKLLGAFCVLIFLIQANDAYSQSSEKVRIGVTLHPYYSFVANIAGDFAEVVPLIGAGSDPHAYKPQPEDIKNVTTLDAIVVNGIGHDEFAFEIIDAARMRDKLTLIYANEGVALMPAAGTAPSENIVNSHTFISISTAIQQIYTIANKLGTVDPDNARNYLKNARAYARTLRKMKSTYVEQVTGIADKNVRIATIHGAYGYLLQEFGLRVSAVVEPRHGLKPSANQLRDTIDKINELNVNVVFSELDFSDKFVDTIQEATGIRLFSFSHISGGEYEKEKFEVEMRQNMENLVSGIRLAIE